jgi:hypothetical protein
MYCIQTNQRIPVCLLTGRGWSALLYGVARGMGSASNSCKHSTSGAVDLPVLLPYGLAAALLADL